MSKKKCATHSDNISITYHFKQFATQNNSFVITFITVIFSFQNY